MNANIKSSFASFGIEEEDEEDGDDDDDDNMDQDDEDETIHQKNFSDEEDEENQLELSNESSLIENTTVKQIFKYVKSSHPYHQINLISEENRLSLTCALILHYYSIGEIEKGRSLVKYMRFSSSPLNLNSHNNNSNHGNRNGNIYNSLTFLSFIATFNTIIVVLQHGVDHLNMDDQTRGTLESVAAFLRLHIGSFSNDVSLTSSRSCSSLVSQDNDDGCDSANGVSVFLGSVIIRCSMTIVSGCLVLIMS
ncbi:unnamed protein product [Ambrosiozyma monospora]|uniref:Unnamed protein product n=1 Tax=Ambrosiozyma monospora TaxID=43982 RepID=A0A9W7DIC3_AMBMO|nr:unnamed protein product [Ambrosiozyma monospora]